MQPKKQPAKKKVIETKKTFIFLLDVYQKQDKDYQHPIQEKLDHTKKKYIQHKLTNIFLSGIYQILLFKKQTIIRFIMNRDEQVHQMPNFLNLRSWWLKENVAQKLLQLLYLRSIVTKNFTISRVCLIAQNLAKRKFQSVVFLIFNIGKISDGCQYFQEKFPIKIS
eukprot:TRINITY_DN3586_c2_g1_i1.p3 TRINITY_DN3586_c2_g1~~TRINITY_DN3586_c2_g1_i1.p3  ORF type:complete len:166 (-),score=1.10 TRINITY_DN3586_c2_g1_i1:12-509(-)